MADVANPIEKLQDEIEQITSKVADLSSAVDNDLPTESGMSYLQVKNHALLAYTKMELFFALLKLQSPDKVQDHPVFKELVRFRTLLERIRPLDRKMAYQVDKMLKVALSGGENLDESLHYAPNPDQLVGEDGQLDDGDEDGEENAASSKDGVYRAPRLAAVHYEEEEREEIKKAKREERNRKRLQKSAILSELREEFSERPTEVQANGGSTLLDKEIAKDEAEKRDFEESRFVRVVESRKDKIRKRQRDAEAMRAEDMGSIDNFAGVQDILSLDKNKHRIPVNEPKSKIGGKVGGIFSHIEVPVEKKRKVGRGNGQPPVSRPATTAPFGSSKQANGESASSSSKPASGKKKKVVFSSIF